MAGERPSFLRVEAIEKPEQDPRGSSGVRPGHGFGGMVADPLLATHEEHPDLRQAGHRHRVVARAARQLAYCEPFGLDRCAEAAHEPWAAPARIGVVRGHAVEHYAAPAPDRRQRLVDPLAAPPGGRRRPPPGRRIVNSTAPGITLTAPGRVLSIPTVPTVPGVSRQIRSIASTASDAAASASPPEAHGHGPCMARPSDHLHPEPWSRRPRRSPPPPAAPPLRARVPARCVPPRRRRPHPGGKRLHPTASGSSPKARNASCSRTPSSSTAVRRAGSKSPATARLPMRVAWNRTPSSSPNAITSTG